MSCFYVIEFPHRGKCKAYVLEGLADLEQAAQTALGENGGRLYDLFSADEVRNACADVDDADAVSPAWGKAFRDGGWVVEEGFEAVWHAQRPPDRSVEDRYEAAVVALGGDLSHLEVIPESEVMAALSAKDRWNQPWGQGGGTRGWFALERLALQEGGIPVPFDELEAHRRFIGEHGLSEGNSFNATVEVDGGVEQISVCITEGIIRDGLGPIEPDMLARLRVTNPGGSPSPAL